MRLYNKIIVATGVMFVSVYSAFIANAAITLTKSGATITSQDIKSTDVSSLTIPASNLSIIKETENASYSFKLTTLNNTGDTIVDKTYSHRIPKQAYNDCRNGGSTQAECTSLVETFIQSTINADRELERRNIEDIKKKQNAQDYWSEFDPANINVTIN